MLDELSELQAWYAAQCDGDWEHQDGIEINTLDNPGWRVTINLEGTALERARFAVVEENYDDETDWLRCWVAERTFQAAGGPMQLTRMLRIFLDWVAAEAKS
jgi:immunity protein 53 of polymorphic toxin system